MVEQEPRDRPSSVEEYVAAAPEAARPALHLLRTILVAAAPDAVESLKWRQPALTRERIVYCFAGFKDHVNFMPTPASLDVFREEALAAGLTATRGVLHIRLDAPFPADLIRRIAEHRAAAEAAGAKFAV